MAQNITDAQFKSFITEKIAHHQEQISKWQAAFEALTGESAAPQAAATAPAAPARKSAGRPKAKAKAKPKAKPAAKKATQPAAKSAPKAAAKSPAKAKTVKAKPAKKGKLKFGDRMVSFMEKADSPLRGKDLFTKNNRATGSKRSNYLSFSGQLSQLTKKGTHIAKYAVPSASRENKYWYAPIGWFDNGKLKANYVAKVAELAKD